MKHLLFFVLLLHGLAILNSLSQTRPRVQLPENLVSSIEFHEGLTYAKYGDREMLLDLYRPKSKTGNSLPAIICVHGGGWSKGERKHHGNLAKALASRGFVAVTISYRLSGEAQFPAQIHDCKAAVRWLRANAETYRITPEKIGTIGLSAGGHLVALLATSNDIEELEGNGGNGEFSSTIQAAIPMGAQTHFMSERNREISAKKEIWQAFLGGSQQEKPNTYKLASPLTHLDASDPPILMMAGEFDDPSTKAIEFRARMKELGIENDFYTIEGAPHGFINHPKFFDICVEKASAFFEKNLKQ